MYFAYNSANTQCITTLTTGVCVLSTYHTVAYSRTLYVKCE